MPDKLQHLKLLRPVNACSATNVSQASTLLLLLLVLMVVCCHPGPALCVVIGGISSLPADKLAQLLALTGSSASSGAAFGASGRGSAAAAPAGGGGACGGGGGGAAAVLQGLASVWAVTDVVQVGGT